MARYKNRKGEQQQGRRDGDDHRHNGGANSRNSSNNGHASSSNRTSTNEAQAKQSNNGGASSNTGPGMSYIQAIRRIRELEDENKVLRATSKCKTEEERRRAEIETYRSIIRERDDMIDMQEAQSNVSSNTAASTKSTKRRTEEEKVGTAKKSRKNPDIKVKKEEGIDSDDDDDDDDDDVVFICTTAAEYSETAVAVMSPSASSSATAESKPAATTTTTAKKRHGTTMTTTATAAAANNNNNVISDVDKIIPQSDKRVRDDGQMLQGQDLMQALKYLAMKYCNLEGDAAHRFAHGPYRSNSSQGIGGVRYHNMKFHSKSLWRKFKKRFLSKTYKSLFEKKQELAKQLYESRDPAFITDNLSQWIEEHGGVVDA